MQHLFPPPVGLFGSRDFSVSESISSNAFVTLELSLALASVKLQLNSPASFKPSSAGTCRSSGFRSLLFPTITIGAHFSPYLGRLASSANVLYREFGGRTRWLRILSAMMRTVSKDCLEATEYTRMYPWMPMKCFEPMILYSSYWRGPAGQLLAWLLSKSCANCLQIDQFKVCEHHRAMRT